MNSRNKMTYVSKKVNGPFDGPNKGFKEYGYSADRETYGPNRVVKHMSLTDSFKSGSRKQVDELFK